MAAVAPLAVDHGAVRLPLPYGLFSTFTFRPSDAGRWETGITYETLACDPLGGIGPWDCSQGATGLPKDLTAETSAVGGYGTGTSFTVYGHFRCSPVGWSAQAAQDKATEQLLAREESRVEKAFWTADLGNTPSLKAGTTTDVSVAGASIDETIGILEAAIATNYGAVGVIHMTRLLATVALATGSLVTSGSRLLTALGTPVAAGGGYPGTGPAAEVPVAHTQWIFATPALMGYRSEVFTSSNRLGDLFGRSANDMYAVAERTYVLSFDPCGVYAALATLPVITLPA